MSKRIILLLFFSILNSGIVPWTAMAQGLDEEVVVTASAYPVPFGNLSRTVKVVSREEIERLPVRTIVDVLRLASSVDLRGRTPFGIQTDLSIRGANFSQVLVLVDGLRINDSQTAHHNADFPVSLDAVERIELLFGPGSSLYGADAFGGAINIITRKLEAGTRARLAVGENGLIDTAFTGSAVAGKLTETVSVSGMRSSGFAFDRDFRTVGISSRTAFGTKSSVLFSHLNKEFGAAGFYGDAPSREWTNQTWLSLDQTLSSGGRHQATLQAFYRTHGDHFLWDMRRPGFFENRHRTHAVGAVTRLGWKVSDNSFLTVGADAGADWINSGNLGDHAFGRLSGFSELQISLGKSAALYPGLRIDDYSNFDSAVNPSLSASWWVSPRVRLRSAAGRAFRIPSFTELYYRDPNHEAYAGLAPETSWAAEMATDVMVSPSSMASVTVFSRWDRNLIDWTRQRPEDKWTTSNIRGVDTRGVELGWEYKFASGATLETEYTYLASQPGSIPLLSKYVMDYARHSWTTSGSIPLPLAFRYAQRTDYRRRHDGRKYWIMDGRLTREFRGWTWHVGCDNFLDSRYQEVLGVNMPGRWCQTGIEVRR
ncbi:MAG: TonB-dependent receptor plug domain-containing protein [Acidobacteriota bacterium]